MSNPVQTLSKISRNLSALGVANTLNSTTVTVTSSSLVISYVAASLQAPMGGVDGTASPYLGIGIANPGVIQVKGAAGQNSIGAIVATADNANALAVCARFANDVSIQAGDTTTELVRLAGHPDLKMMGA